MTAEAAARKARGRLLGPVRIHLQQIRSMATSGAGGDHLVRELGELDSEIVGAAALLGTEAAPAPSADRCTCREKTRLSAPPCPVHDSLPGTRLPTQVDMA